MTKIGRVGGVIGGPSASIPAQGSGRRSRIQRRQVKIEAEKLPQQIVIEGNCVHIAGSVAHGIKQYFRLNLEQQRVYLNLRPGNTALQSAQQIEQALPHGIRSSIESSPEQNMALLKLSL